MIVTITEFSEQRNEDRDTVNAFIRKHPEIRRDVSRQGKHSVIDTKSDGYALLDKQYPLPKPIEIIEDRESREKLIKAQELIIQLQDKLSQSQVQIAQATAMKLLLEDKEAQLEKEEKRAEIAEKRVIKSEEEIEILRLEMKELKEMLEREKSKTWIQKLLNKA